MLVRTDPFREFDRLTQQALGTMTRPAVMPMDAVARQRRRLWLRLTCRASNRTRSISTWSETC
jgi:hypothetical protein